nr:RNA-directed DNA polymerase, eukaryota, reverse transcriptase zinc-binding domain protein [Tanacetum cinerariifolium]
MAQQVILAAQLVSRFHTIGKYNNYVVLQSIPCSPECKIVGRFLLDHPLSYALTATAYVPVVYLQQFWRTISKLPVETPKNPFVALVNIETIDVFMNKVGYQGVVDKVSAFYMKNLAQPWQTMFKKFPEIPKRIEEDYHSIKDDIPLEYETLFMMVDVPMNQPQPVVSTQGTHRSTPRAHMTPTLTTSPQEKKRKQTAKESSSPRQSHKITIKRKKPRSESIKEESRVEKVAGSFDDNVADDLEDIIKDLKEDKQKEEAIDKISKDESWKKDINEISLIHELLRLIEVGGSLGFDKAFSHEKLKVLKPKIKQWVTANKRNEDTQKKDLMKDLRIINDKIEAGLASNDDRDKRIKILQEAHNLVNLEDMDTIQKARVKLDIEGDENSNLKINIPKSNIYGIDVSSEDVHLMVSNTSCAAGLLTLIKSVLGSLSIYYLSIFKVHEMILNSLEKMRATFFWGGSLVCRKLAWLKWSNIVAFFDKGGLNIGSLKSFDLSLLQKWRWIMLLNPNSLWVSINKALHGIEWGFDSNGCNHNGLWAKIVGSSNYLHSSNILHTDSIRFQVGCDS